jgi:hypothetical protein
MKPNARSCKQLKANKKTKAKNEAQRLVFRLFGVCSCSFNVIASYFVLLSHHGLAPAVFSLDFAHPD